SNGAWTRDERGSAVRAPRRRFGMATYRSHVPSVLPSDPAAEPPGFVVVVEPGDRIHFLDWGGPDAAGVPGVVLVHGLSASSWVWAPRARRIVPARRPL